jgi:transcriptional regulator with XRE-family HTH domain
VYLGRVVKALRAEAGLSQDGLSARAGIDSTYISRLERGHRNPTWTTLGRLSRGLRVTRWELVKRADELGRG